MSLRIIIADDHPVVRIGTRAVIESSGVGRVVGEADSAQALMALLGCVGMGALMCVNRSLKLAPASVVVPYQYTMIVWAVLFGYWGFGDVPKPNVIAGAAVIVAAGLYIFLREQAQGRIAPAPNPPA